MPKAKTAKGLTPRQRKFVDAYLLEPNATKAAIKAGYSANAAHSCGPRLLENAGVREAIDSRLGKASEQAIITKAEVLKGLKKEASGTQPDSTATSRVAAFGLLGKHLAMFTEKVEHSFDLGELLDQSGGGEQ